MKKSEEEEDGDDDGDDDGIVSTRFELDVCGVLVAVAVVVVVVPVVLVVAAITRVVGSFVSDPFIAFFFRCGFFLDDSSCMTSSFLINHGMMYFKYCE